MKNGKRRASAFPEMTQKKENGKRKAAAFPEKAQKNEKR
jgi:hypothetical protein